MNTSRKHLLSLALITALSPIASTTAFAQLYLEIAKAPDQAPKIAIVPFTNDNGLYPIVETDLNRSGRFTSSSKNFPANAAINQIQASDWQAAGIPYVVTGQIKQTATGFEVHYQLYDVQKQQYILNELLNVPAARIRQAGHMVSDAIYQALTGIPGDFSGRIAYVLRNPATPAERYTLQIADTDGEQPKTVLSSRDPILSPAWTPDAKKIAYVSFETKRPAIYLQDLSTGTREVLTSFRGLNGAPSFSPDGQSMLFTASMNGNPEIYQMDLSTRQVKRMTNDSAIDTEARYTPDGKSFIFTSDRGGSAQIYRYTFADGSVKRLTFKGSFNARGTLSADGKKIALVHRPSGSSYKVAIQDINTGITNILTPTSLDESPSFSPNGQMVVYATREGNRGLLSIMSTDGRFRMNLPSEQGEVREPAWAPK
ncbi:tol-Pal system beta propeller repeat protein TolB [Acinetobacter sp. 723929]|uniref:Tol-Pal system beta propeller repeat protein TolB n=1 Tax=unclassified Acinetobacter calcoaceticus/baumannii complex TaxID=2881046 RepID=UPI00044E216C|nr:MULTISPECIES: Tol-Pal system beta propeller repeat protein TolB [unclassified Acinetobacter calcoaceticus/baumannii complex]EXG33833.1 tol-Pal system beta propeller repeat protein TolB [Acinetobacter sp. 263903-2]EXI19088.1 tol-Pal system beta propeller repeat protein TolB [Acinetobacter sp. 723929]EXS18398.1 tol-Pal system beta propeller repeat protein TolB [Acinetobacter sp. 883425]EXS36660.1 tol-Pal system beta propeller repeat protein TolB [Acinetobacter sp. 826659]